MHPALIPALLAVCWGLNWPIIKIVLSVVPPFTLRWVGLGAGGLLLLGYAMLQRRPLWPTQWPRLIVAGLLNVAGFNLCTAFAQLSTSTSRASVLTYTMPMISALMAWALLGERPDRRRAAALALGSAGIALLAWPVVQRLQAGELDARTLRGLVMPLLAATAWAAGTVFTKRWPIAGDRAASTGWQLMIGALCGGIGAALTGERWPDTVPTVVLAALVYHIIVATAFAYLIWFVLLERFSATVSSLTTLMVPVVGVIGAMALVGDRPSALDWAGFVLVLGGAAMVVLRLGR
ncbi:DMT family transporter [Ideonella sp. A 288]|uniref:DMT family transporter n=1 Tax=Ideonella sp. A 288 TaxID=1962181 RepID=UPI000B4C149D|nr:DMT family transporter [Ideonella sp. A 288]